MTPKYLIGTLVKTKTGLKEIQSIHLYQDMFEYAFDGETFKEADIIYAYSPIIEKPKRVRRKKVAKVDNVLTVQAE